ncbi:CHAD domain-containing protein [Euzebya rosea]|uniref:CHAD domain-containing protein n=1 Tax=Euzebya rosea TaxID=2052804 RepID=UPI000D3E1111|nr:CHAD domain-containing protein [Euzebya rosea]
MPFAIQHGEDLANALRRIAGEQAARGLDALSTGMSHPADAIDPHGEDAWDEGVHDARKRCKKVRAVARLCRDALGDGYSPINAAFRDAARIVADARDAWALVETVDLLASRDDDDLCPEEVARDIRRAVVDRYHRVRTAAAESGLPAEAHSALRDAAADIDRWPLSAGMTAADLEPSIARVHGRGRDRWLALRDTLQDDPDEATEEWHDWRKRVKYLRYQVLLLEEAWPEVMSATESLLHDLTDALGEDHDLAVLVDVLRDEQLLDPARTTQAAGAINAQRHALRHDAMLLAPLVYAEPTAAFASRVIGWAAHGLALD